MSRGSENTAGVKVGDIIRPAGIPSWCEVLEWIDEPWAKCRHLGDNQAYPSGEISEYTVGTPQKVISDPLMCELFLRNFKEQTK